MFVTTVHDILESVSFFEIDITYIIIIHFLSGFIYKGFPFSEKLYCNINGHVQISPTSNQNPRNLQNQNMYL